MQFIFLSHAAWDKCWMTRNSLGDINMTVKSISPTPPPPPSSSFPVWFPVSSAFQHPAWYQDQEGGVHRHHWVHKRGEWSSWWDSNELILKVHFLCGIYIFVWIILNILASIHIPLLPTNNTVWTLNGHMLNRCMVCSYKLGKFIVTQYIGSTHTLTSVSYPDFTDNSYDYFLSKAGLFWTKLSLTTNAWTQVVYKYNTMNQHCTKSPFFCFRTTWLFCASASRVKG